MYIEALCKLESADKSKETHITADNHQKHLVLDSSIRDTGRPE